MRIVGVIEGVRWCPTAQRIEEWDESQEDGCVWCPESAAGTERHLKVAIVDE